MSRGVSRKLEPRALEIIEEATHLVRRAPARILAEYYVGSLPFALALLYFWSDMSRSAFAEARRVPFALGLALLFVWMKVWQARYARSLRELLAPSAAPPWTPRLTVRLVATQSLLHATGCFLLPITLLVVLPLGWVYAAYQNLTVLGGAGEGSMRRACGRAVEHARLWPRQNHVILVLFGMFAFFVFLNVLTLFLAVPYLLNMLLGIRTLFVLSPYNILNTTLLAAATGITYLCVDPLVKAAYVLRVFYGESIRSGEDLLAQLAPVEESPRLGTADGGGGRVPARSATVLLLVAIVTASSGWVAAAPAGGEVESESSTGAVGGALAVEHEDLSGAIREVLARDEYAWRMPRDAEDTPHVPDEEGFWSSLFRWIRDFLDWLFSSRRGGGDTNAMPSLGLERGLVWILIGVAAALIAYCVWRLFRGRVGAGSVASPPLVAIVPDLTDESLSADRLPEDGWLKLAAELMARGESRLALRALYLAGLAHLGARGLIAVNRYKTNADYRRELARRARSFPVVISAFGENVAAFEQSWYGTRAVKPDDISAFTANLRLLRAA